MTEEDARGWIVTRFGEAASERVGHFLDQVIGENRQQNLIAPATVPEIWARHALDSAQLVPLAPAHWQHWLDIGTGGGFPGLVVALLAPDRRVTLSEPRRKRAEFLRHCVELYGLDHTIVEASKVEAGEVAADVISARAVSSVENILLSAHGRASDGTTWILPRGRSGDLHLAGMPKLSRTTFHVEHSAVDAKSVILVLQGDGS